MAYNKDIPQATDLISNSQSALLANFAALNTQFGVDHTAFETSTFPSDGDGFHKKVSITPVQVGDPAIVTGKGILYTKSVTLGAETSPQLFYRTISTPGAVSQIVQVGGPVSASGNGYCFLFGGMIVQWGNSATTGSAVSFPLTFPANAFSMVVTGTSTLYTGGFVVSSLSTSQFTVSRTSGSGATGYYWIALGN